MSEMHSVENDAPVREYRGWFGRHARRRCPHSRLVGIYGDAINHNGGWRLGCLQCGKYLDGPVHLARARMGEYVIPSEATPTTNAARPEGDDSSAREGITAR